MPKLSIITATYNRVDTLKKTFDSIKNQGMTDIEHIIVDNISDDGTQELVLSYQAEVNYPVIYIRERDSGIYNAMNKGLRRASGTWTHILNSDDSYYDDEVLTNFFAGSLNDFDICANAVCIVNEKTHRRKTWNPQFQEERNWYHFPHPGLFIRKHFYEQYGYYSERYKIVSDAIWMSQHLSSSRSMIKNNIVVTMAKGGISSRKSWRNFYETFILIVRYSRVPLSYKIIRLLKLIQKYAKYWMRQPLSTVKKLCRK